VASCLFGSLYLQQSHGCLGSHEHFPLALREIAANDPSLLNVPEEGQKSKNDSQRSLLIGNTHFLRLLAKFSKRVSGMEEQDRYSCLPCFLSCPLVSILGIQLLITCLPQP